MIRRRYNPIQAERLIISRGRMKGGCSVKHRFRRRPAKQGLLIVGHHRIPFITETPNRETKPITGGDTEIQIRKRERQDPACDRERDAGERQQALEQAI